MDKNNKKKPWDNILYLIQAKGRMPEQYYFFRERNYILLSYKEETDDTDIFFPKSTWTTGRNKLVDICLKMKPKYKYFALLDEDLQFSFNVLKKFEQDVVKLDAPIIVPNMWNKNTRKTHFNFPINQKGLQNNKFRLQTVDWFDGAFNVFRRDVLENKNMFPLETKYDKNSWWVSQLIMIMRANLYYLNGIIQANYIMIKNIQHSNYPSGPQAYVKVYKEFLKQKNIKVLKMSDAKEIKIDNEN